MSVGAETESCGVGAVWRCWRFLLDLGSHLLVLGRSTVGLVVSVIVWRCRVCVSRGVGWEDIVVVRDIVGVEEV